MAALQIEYREEENAVLQPSFLGYIHDSDRHCTASAEETSLFPFSILLAIKLLDLALFIFTASQKDKRMQILPFKSYCLFSPREILYLSESQTNIVAGYLVEYTIRCCHFSYLNIPSCS